MFYEVLQKSFSFIVFLTTVCLGFWYYMLLSLSSLSSTPIAAYSSIHTFSCNAKLILVFRLLVGGDESAHFVVKCMLKNNLKFKTKKERMEKTIYNTCFQNSMHHGNPLSRIRQAMDCTSIWWRLFAVFTQETESLATENVCWAVRVVTWLTVCVCVYVWDFLATELLSPLPSCHCKARDWWKTAEPCSFFFIFQIDSLHSDLKWHIQCRTV